MLKTEIRSSVSIELRLVTDRHDANNLKRDSHVRLFRAKRPRDAAAYFDIAADAVRHVSSTFDLTFRRPWIQLSAFNQFPVDNSFYA